MAPHSSTLAWRIPWMEEPRGLQSWTRLSDFLSLLTFMHWRRKWQPTPVFLPGESQGWGAWWAAIYGATQSQTRLKRLSSSSSVYFNWKYFIARKMLTIIWVSCNILQSQVKDHWSQVTITKIIMKKLKYWKNYQNMTVRETWSEQMLLQEWHQ